MRKQILCLQKSASGFTLVELLVSIAITGMLIIIIMNFMVGTVAQGSISTAQSDLLREAQLTLDTVNNDVRLSASAELHNRYADPYAPTSGDQYSWTSNNSTMLVLATAVHDKNDNVVFEDALHYVSYKNNNIYFVKNGTLYKRILAAPVSNNKVITTCPASSATSTCPADAVLLHNIQSFSIKYYNADNQIVAPDSARSIEINVVLQQRKYGRNLTANYTARTVFRND